MRSSLAWSSLVAVLVAAAGPSHAQRTLRRTQVHGPPILRSIPLGERAVYQLAAHASGHVLIGGNDELIRITPSGNVQLEELADIGYGDMHGAQARAIAADAEIVAGSGLTADNFYAEATWWDAEAPLVPHHLGGSTSMLLAVENTPGGLVMVGFSDDQPIDVRPEGSGILPGVEQLAFGQAAGLSADGHVYCGRSGHPFSSKAVRWIDRVPEALHDPVGQRSQALGVSKDGLNFAGSASNGSVDTPVVWLAQDGLVLRRLLHPNGSTLSGQANAILDDGFTVGQSSSSPRFGWVWHPSFGSDRVMSFDDWLVGRGLSPVDCPAVRDVCSTPGSYHFSVAGDSTHDARYVQTPN